MVARKPLEDVLHDIASSAPAPGGGSVAALAGALGAALTAMVGRLTAGKKKYAGVEADMKKIVRQADALRATFTALVDRDAQAFNKVIEAYGLPKDSESQKALRKAAVREATREASLVPLEVMKHCIDGLALARDAARRGNANSVTDAGVAALMLHASCEGAALNVLVNLGGLDDRDFVGWKTDEVQTLLATSGKMLEEIRAGVRERMSAA